MTTHDGDRLRALLGSRNRAEFARAHKLRGGGSMVGQHLSGHRPISLEAAMVYARGLSCTIDDISPSTADLVRTAHHLLSNDPAGRQEQPPTFAEALPHVLSRLPGLDGYTADKVLGALRAAIEGRATLEQVEQDLLQWLSQPQPAAAQHTKPRNAA